MAEPVKFFAPPNRYAEGAPVLISASRYEADPDAGTCFAQILVRSVSPVPITDVTLSLNTFSADGAMLDEVPGWNYGGLNLNRGEIAGFDTVIPLRDPRAAGMVSRCLSVRFADGTVWTAPEGAVWTPIKADRLDDLLASAPAAPAFEAPAAPVFEAPAFEAPGATVIPGAAPFVPQPEPSFQPEQRFQQPEQPPFYPQPEQSYQPAQPFQPEQPFRQPEQPPFYPQPEQSYQPAQPFQPEQPFQPAQPVPEAPKKKKGKLGLILGIAGGALALLIAGLVLAVVLMLPQLKYNNAVEQMQSGDYAGYAKAAAAFEELGDYKDAPALAADCRMELAYLDALQAFDRGDYLAAEKAFAALGSFRDAKQRAETCRRLDALQRLEAYKGSDDYDDLEAFFYNLDEKYRGDAEFQQTFWTLGFGMLQQRLDAGDVQGAFDLLNRSWATFTPDDRAEETAKLEEDVEFAYYDQRLEAGDYAYDLSLFYYNHWQAEGDEYSQYRFLLSLHLACVADYYENERSLLITTSSVNDYVENFYYSTNVDFYRALREAGMDEEADHHCYDQCRLYGNWSDSDGHYLKMSSNGGINYNIPVIDYGDYYVIYDGAIQFYPAGEEDNRKDAILISFNSEDSITLYSYEDGQSYTMTRD